MRIYFSPYRLLKKTQLNSADVQSEQHGVLLKVAEGSFWGVADLCTKVELGDLPFTEELRKRGPLFRRALELACRDLEARKKSESLLSHIGIENNFLITNHHDVDFEQEKFAQRTLKIKCDGNLDELSRSLQKVQSSTTLRLDFNNSLRSEEFNNWLTELPSDLKAKVQYIEDPTPLNEQWPIWNMIVPLAYDFQSAAYTPAMCKYRIIKPTREAVPELNDATTLTSAMEHPVGLAHGLSLAQQLSPQTVSGFLTLDLFFETEFHRFFCQQGHLLNFTDEARQDSGIGMTEELEKLNWQRYD